MAQLPERMVRETDRVSWGESPDGPARAAAADDPWSGGTATAGRTDRSLPTLPPGDDVVPGEPAEPSARQVGDDASHRPAVAGAPETGRPLAVAIESVNLPFWSLVGLFLKLALAAVPALVLLFGLFIALLALLGTLVGTAIVAALTEFASRVIESVPWF